MTGKSIAISLGVFLLMSILVLLWFVETVPAGNVGVRVHLLGSNKGVDYDVLGVGRYFIGINEKLYIFPTYTQNYVWTADESEGSEEDESITFQTKEGLSVNGDFGISFHIEKSKVGYVFEKYRRGIDEITDVFLRNKVRNALNRIGSGYPVEYIYGEGKSFLMDSVITYVKESVEPIGIIIEDIYIIGDLRLPERVVNALNAKIEAKQRAEQRENELREAEAQAKKQIAQSEGEAKSLLIKAQAEAEALKIKNRALTEKIIRYETVKRWNGELPMITGDAIPMIQLPE